MVRTAEFIQSSLLPMVVRTCVEFRGNHCRQDGALEDPGVFAQPSIVFSLTEPDVHACVEEKRAGWKWNHDFFAGARPKTSAGPPSLRRFLRARRPASTARRSSITSRTASELLRDWRALRSRWTFLTSSKRFVRVNAALLTDTLQCVCSFEIIHNIAFAHKPVLVRSATQAAPKDREITALH